MRRGKRRATSADVARIAGVSRTTVSYVLNRTPGQTISPATQKRVREAAEQLGYIPNVSGRSLRGGTSDVVLLAVPHFPHGINLALLQGAMAQHLARIGKVMVTWLEEAGSLRETLSHITPAAIIAPASMRAPERKLALSLDIPLIDAFAPDFAGGVGFRSLIAKTQVNHLVERGHTTLAYTAPSEPEWKTFVQGRLDALRLAAVAAGASTVASIDLGRPQQEDPDRVATVLANVLEQGVTGVACHNDVHAAQLLEACRRLGVSVPDRLALIGVNDDPLSVFLSPALTTVGTSPDRFAYALVAECAAALEWEGFDPSEPEEDYVRVIMRETT